MRSLRDELEQIQQAIIAKHQSEIAALEAEHQRLQNELRTLTAGYNQKLRHVWLAISQELEENQPDLADYPLPEANEAAELPETLYDSERSYFEQIRSYKAFQGRLEAVA